mmetsp:Transcript_13400/g.30931  ORF Transcript_13400/g.30931 Transcript_13400/m.30931 type:complete len:364 (+) Transcript_13400:3-1094(+)
MQPGVPATPIVDSRINTMEDTPLSSTAIEVNAELRELYIKATRQLRESEARELRLQDDLRQKGRELSLARSQEGAMREVEGLRRDLERSDAEIGNLRSIVKRVGEEHARTLDDLASSLQVAQNAQLEPAKKDVRIQNLESALSWAIGDGAAEVERQRLTAENSRLHTQVALLDVRLAGALAARTGVVDEQESVRKQLRDNASVISQQSREIARMADKGRILSLEKDRLLEQVRSGTSAPHQEQPKDGGMSVADLHERLLEKDMALSALKHQLHQAALDAQNTAPGQGAQAQMAQREEILAVRERNILLETDLKVHSTLTEELREELWQIKASKDSAMRTTKLNGESLSQQGQSLQDYRKQRGF